MNATAEKVKHTPGDVNHKFLGAGGYDFCPTCGSSLRGKRTLLEIEMREALEDVVAYAPHEKFPFTPQVEAAIRKAKGEAA